MFNFHSLANKYQLIMVDIDNTLFNYTYAHNKALQNVLKKYNFSMEDYEYARMQIKARDLSVNHHKKELYFKLMCEEKNIHFIQAKNMFELYIKEFLYNIKVDKTMFDFLVYAKSINRKILAITNFYFIEQINKLNYANLSLMLDFLICSEEFEVEKPHKKLIDRAFELAKIDSKDKVVMIGDSIADDLGIYDIKYYPYNCSKLLISISGKSGSGKSTLGSAIKSVCDCMVIGADGYHKFDRYSTVWERITHYNPEGNNLIQLALDIKCIYQDIHDLCIPLYDHVSGNFLTSDLIKTKDLDIVIIEGLHTLYQEVIGDFVKIKIFIDSDESDNQKIQRDIKERGYKLDKIINSIQKREEDYLHYLYKQKDNANFLITIRNKKFKIELSGILKSANLQNIYEGEYHNLIDTIKDIMSKIINNRWVK
ncbi:HAD hydrolase-like protein [Campylobacter jejuni]|nr:HAD hydrolase-like protein [Campylobacter jejuni]EGH5142420.1 HAD hydrolase-like protein [Campylobacter jejuni]EHH2437923.1 HAD hydrolase-like protein [Campylobacter jejuni]EHR3059696.1 HAD hydrolase-like protein [Campylobacter jejuni]EHZ0433558.1 HAD hydrolase-like protein [Campylobacter jejuni]